MVKKIGNLSVYNNLDPDAIYKPGSMTFFLTQDGNLHIQPYPTNHRDMLEEDDVFFAVYPELRRAKIGKKQRIELSSRGQALVKSKALLGRIGAVGDTICIIFWTEPTSEQLKLFTDKLFEKFSQFKTIKSKIVVIGPQSGAKTLGGKTKTKLPKVDTTAASSTPVGQETEYSPEEIEMYKRMHTASPEEKKAIMAHLGVGGGGNENPWQTALRQAGLLKPGQKWWAPTSEGLTFKNWLENE